MNNPILNLLLNFNGTAGRKSYCAAVVLFLFIIGLSAFRAYFDLFSTTFAYSVSSALDVRAYILFKGLMWVFTPALIPAYFLIFYSVVVVTIKRSRALNLSGLITVLFVLINSMFFNLLLKSRGVIEYIYAYAGDADMEFLVSPQTVFYLAGAFIVLGTLINLYLMLNNKGEDEHSLTSRLLSDDSSAERVYNQFTYILFVGRWMLINFIIMAVIGVSIFIFGDFFEELVRSKKGLRIVLSLTVLYFGVFFGLYMHATAKRLNDAGYKTYLLVLYVISIFLLSAFLAYFIGLKTSYSLILLGISNAFIVCVSAFQMIPFLLQSKTSD